jgi:hypothetical protein
VTALDYRTRVAGIRAALNELHKARPYTDLPAHFVDQLDAAHTQAFAQLRRFGAVEQMLEPDRWTRPHETSDDVDRVIDVQAHVLAAMGEGQRWPVCIHLRRTPTQPAYVLLPVRRIDCDRCIGTFRQPPADEADRCDLCGARGITEFWPLRMAVAYWIVLGDTCQSCARELANPAAA